MPIMGGLIRAIRDSVCVPGKRQGRAVHLLRFPGRSLATSPVHQSHRIHLQHRSTPHTPDQRMRLPKRHDDDGLQTGRPSPKTLAQITQSQTH